MKRGYDLPKRLIDVVAAGAGLVLVSPLLLAAAVAIRLEDGGPALFRQTRAGRGRRPFRIFKFRSMVVDADRLLDASGKPTGQRVTRVGKLLRFTSLDELPQLLNVLLGDMSLVGPRPGLPEQAERYDATQLRRFEVRPGLTGLAQVKGRNTLKWSERLRYDVEYVDGRSL
ncbi:MAG TPA: sugar transferase, partial [Holophagaceae bacterium]|nr:sugar transferase [Holophagaceae bacterium]